MKPKLFVDYPSLELEWDFEKNTSVCINKITFGSSKYVWWKCLKCGSSWNARISHRTRGDGCPYCSCRKVKIGINDFATFFPELASEWHPTKNGTLKPTDVSIKSNKLVWWECSFCGNEWQSIIANRIKNNRKGCPKCLRKASAEKRRASNLAANKSFANKYPHLLDEWNREKNGNLDPFTFTAGSHEKVWWKCEKGHEWQATIHNRTYGRKCPYCSGRYVDKGVNDLVSSAPILVKEWHPTKNKGLDPIDFSIGSGKKIWWKCERGHEWQATIAGRKKGVIGCPICARELHTSLPEQAIIFYLSKITNVKNRFLVNGFELDIYMSEYDIGIEYDGEFYHSKERAIKKEDEKDKYFKSNGLKFIRIKENSKLDGVQIINNVIFYNPSKNYSFLGDAIRTLLCMCKIEKNLDIDVMRDLTKIREQYLSFIKKDGLFIRRPDLLKEWHPTKNGLLDPSYISYASNYPVWWKCEKGHEWQASPNNRTKHNCPYCSNQKIIKGDNDFATKYPDIAKEWHPTKNGSLYPWEVSSGTERKVWWLCPKCKNEYLMSVHNRVIGNKCHKCSKKDAVEKQKRNIIIKNGSLLDNHPILAKEWHPTKNGLLKPNDVSCGSNAKVWWRCAKGHEWQDSVSHRTVSKRNCPYCSGRKVLAGDNDFESNYPELMKEWNYNKNVGLNPSSFSSHSGFKVWWKCAKCGHEWRTSIYHRTSGTNCPICNRGGKHSK